MGLAQSTPEVDIEALTSRINGIASDLNDDIVQLLQSQGVRMFDGIGRFTGPQHGRGDRSERHRGDRVRQGAGRRPDRVPASPTGASPTAIASSPHATATRRKVFPDSITVVGSGVTGVEFVHMFSSFGADVTLVVSRQHVLPGKDPEVAGVLEDDFIERGVRLLKGARAESIERTDDGTGTVVRCDDGRVVRSTHAVLAIGSVPNTDELGLDAAGVEVDEWGYIPINHHCVTNQRHIYAAGDVSRKAPARRRSPRCRAARSPST